MARKFFAERDVMEVDCIAMGQKASIDANIDLFSVPSPIHGERFLFSSPEYPMKRLISEGSGDIYYLGHVWRHEPHGEKHSPEFLIAEWYRIGMSFRQLMEETIEFIELFVGKKPYVYVCYYDAFVKYVQLDPFSSSMEEIREACKKCGALDSYPCATATRDDLLYLLVSAYIEPQFDPNVITIFYEYPASQAALARRKKDARGHFVAERFEAYVGQIELANGYHELADAKEQAVRFVESNNEREVLGKVKYPIDDKFLLALERGFPDCSGVAVGVDRLLMLKDNVASINDVMPISWPEA
jgi:lysyl-tRNA synthetase class 2